MKFRVGERVKKVRGDKYIGMTAVVVDFSVTPGSHWHGFKGAMRVRSDIAFTDIAGNAMPPGSIAQTIAELWEPLRDRPELSTWDAIRELGIDVHATGVAEVTP